MSGQESRGSVGEYNDMKLTAGQIRAADVDGNGEIRAEDAQWLLIYYTERIVAGKTVTWEDLIGK